MKYTIVTVVIVLLTTLTVADTCLEVYRRVPKSEHSITCKSLRFVPSCTNSVDFGCRCHRGYLRGVL